MGGLHGMPREGKLGAGRAAAGQQPYSPGNAPHPGAKEQMGHYPGVRGLTPNGQPAVNFSLLMNGAFAPYQNQGREHEGGRREGLHTIWG